MKRITLLPTILLIPLLFSISLLSTCDSDRSSGFESKRDQNFNQGWSFHRGQAEGAEKSGFDDSEWRVVDLPHDWSIEDFTLQDSLHTGPFYKGLDGGADVGYLRGGTGWYRKTFTLDNGDEDKQVFLHFDGVQSEMKLWVNGHEVGSHVYGYTPFFFDLTPHLQLPGQANQIAIRVVNPESNSRWYNGAGIYRQVTISMLNQVYVNVWGLNITTPQINDSEAVVSLDINLCNKHDVETECTLVTEILSPSGLLISNHEQQVKRGPRQKEVVTVQIQIENPELWDLENPALYSARISVIQAGKKVDEYSTSFGIRSIEYSAESGFLLNGREVLLHGACIHHDNGLLGAAAFNRAEERRVMIMKENGYNAIRTSHNPPSDAFLDACDRLGMFVIDESFDMWVRPKRPNDYHLHFDEWWQRDLESMLLRDRNHPSVIMWSFGNEVQERANVSGLAIAEEMINYIKSIDPTRPVTQAICGFWDNPGKEWDDSSPAFEMLDIGGYNYQWTNYELDHEKAPARIMYGSESVPKEAFENWQLVKTHAYVIGDFVWTGMDYIGESGIGHSEYYSERDDRDHFLMPWPWYISWCGDIDIIGNKKPQSYYRDVVWGQSNLEIMVHEPVPEGMEEVVSFWGWPLERKSWNWKGHEGKSLHVNVYSSYPKVRLELNGKIIGEETLNSNSKLTAGFVVPFEPGNLRAIGVLDGVDQESQTISTTGTVTGLKLIPERTVINADRNELVYVRILGTDSDNNLVPDADTQITIKISGEGELLAAGSGSPLIEGSLQDDVCSLFRGEALLIIRSSGKAGSITVEASSLVPEANAQTHISVQ